MIINGDNLVDRIDFNDPREKKTQLPKFDWELPTGVMAAKKSQKEAENEVRSWGFDIVFTWTDGPYAPITHLVSNPS